MVDEFGFLARRFLPILGQPVGQIGIKNSEASASNGN